VTEPQPDATPAPDESPSDAQPVPLPPAVEPPQAVLPAPAPGAADPGANQEGAGRYGRATEAKAAEVIEAANRYGASSIIALAGVPGTGKSYVGQIAAQRIAGDPTRVREVQFHPSTTYEEFVEGLRTDSSGGIDEMPGLFLEWNQLALDDEDNRYVLLIDELTRAKVNAVLGELLTFIEDRNRSFTATYSRRPVKVAKNLVVLATYNPTDRSAIEIDGALLRRLRIIRFNPDESQLREMLAARSMPAHVVSKLASLFTALRGRHRDFDDQMPFGHGLFAEVRAEAPDLHQLWEQRIRFFLYRPLVSPHPYAADIHSAYPWHESSYREPVEP
jgi:5-methylcytosine-specific restriction protein B